MHVHWDVAARIVNSAGCVLAMCFLVIAAIRQYKNWNNKTQTHWWALIGWVFLGFEGALENLYQHNPPGPRTVIQSLVIAWTLRALMSRQKLTANAAFPQREDSADE